MKTTSKNDQKCKKHETKNTHRLHRWCVYVDNEIMTTADPSADSLHTNLSRFALRAFGLADLACAEGKNLNHKQNIIRQQQQQQQNYVFNPVIHDPRNAPESQKRKDKRFRGLTGACIESTSQHTRRQNDIRFNLCIHTKPIQVKQQTEKKTPSQPILLTR